MTTEEVIGELKARMIRSRELRDDQEQGDTSAEQDTFAFFDGQVAAYRDALALIESIASRRKTYFTKERGMR